MKTKSKYKKYFSIFLAAVNCLILILSFSSCELFTFSKIEENENTAKSSSTITLNITPKFGDESLNTEKSSRSAFPDFSSFSGYTFKVTSSVLDEDVTGTYDFGTGDISFSLALATFNEAEEFTFYICNSSGKELFYGTQKFSYTTPGSDIEKTVYFKSYNSSVVKGNINLTLSAPTDYTVSCQVINSADMVVSGASGSGQAIEVQSSLNTCTIKTTSAGIAAGTYDAKFTIKKDGITRDFIIQQINVWPGLTTNTWYLPDGNTAGTYSVTISRDFVKLWVKGSDNVGPYESDITVPVSYTADGSITKPYTSLNDAIAVCTSSTTAYTIKVCGTVTGTSTIGSSISADSILIEGVSGSDVDILKGNSSGSIIRIEKAISITLKNLKITNGSASYGGGLYISNGADVVLENGVLITENTAYYKGGGIYLYGNNSKLTMKTGSTVSKNTITTTNGNEYGGAGIYIGSASYSDNSAELILEGGEISEHDLGYSLRGAGVFVSYSKLTVKSGKITKNKATDIAANVMLDNSSVMEMSGGEISYGEINGITDASAAGVWINNLSSMNMSGGKICNNTVKAAERNVGRGAGVTLWENAASFTMTGGEISNNLVDSTNSDIIQGGAIYIDKSFSISGNSYIPYGVNGSNGIGKNDIYIKSSKTIKIDSELTHTGKIGVITPETLFLGTKVFEKGTNCNSDTFTSMLSKFSLTDGSTYKIENQNVLGTYYGILAVNNLTMAAITSGAFIAYFESQMEATNSDVVYFNNYEEFESPIILIKANDGAYVAIKFSTNSQYSIEITGKRFASATDTNPTSIYVEDLDFTDCSNQYGDFGFFYSTSAVDGDYMENTDLWDLTFTPEGSGWNVVPNNSQMYYIP